MLLAVFFVKCTCPIDLQVLQNIMFYSFFFTNFAPFVILNKRFVGCLVTKKDIESSPHSPTTNISMSKSMIYLR